MTGPRSVIDIGSNSVRLVIYEGPARAPLTRFNEKVMVGLGRGLALNGAMGEGPRRRATDAMVRFARLSDAAGCDRPLIVATAAVRDASDGPAFVDRLSELGLAPLVLSGDEEGRMSALGVRAGDPDATGVVADLGGGSLELAELDAHGVGQSVSLPLGVLRIGALATGRPRALAKVLTDGLKAAGWRDWRPGALHLVGGSFRALAALDNHWLGRQPPALHGLILAPDRAAALRRRLARASDEALASLPDVANARRAQMPAAASLLAALVERLDPTRLVVSVTGLREGLLFDRLDEAAKAEDPLIAAVRYEAEDRADRAVAGQDGSDLRAGRLGGGGLGGAVDRWIEPVFDDPPDMARLRLAAAHLAGTGWRANPSFRAERAAEMAFHGAWIGVGPRGRALMAAALGACFGGGSGLESQLTAWCDPAALTRARDWGLALRLARRFSGGVPAALDEGRLVRARGRLELRLTGRLPAGEVVERRLRQLGAALSCDGIVVAAGAQ